MRSGQSTETISPHPRSTATFTAARTSASADMTYPCGSSAPSGWRADLATLRVQEEGPQDGYSRERFEHWIDADDDGGLRERGEGLGAAERVAGERGERVGLDLRDRPSLIGDG